MHEEEFGRYLTDRNLAENTIYQKIAALKRIERFHELDLDSEFDEDELSSLIERFRYSAHDARERRPNPTRMDIEQDRLLTQLRWYLSHLNDYRRFKGSRSASEPTRDVVSEEIEAEVVSEAVSQTFGLERDLQAALRASIGQLEAGLEIIDDGSEVKVEAGFIDILARDSHGTFTVIELKSDASKPAAIAQILAYMSCVAIDKNEAVRGILVAGSHDPRVVMAARAVPNLMLKSYRYRFEFV